MSISDAHIEAQAIWAECDMPQITDSINQKDWEELEEYFYELAEAVLGSDYKTVQQFVKEKKDE